VLPRLRRMKGQWSQGAVSVPQLPVPGMKGRRTSRAVAGPWLRKAVAGPGWPPRQYVLGSWPLAVGVGRKTPLPTLATRSHAQWRSTPRPFPQGIGRVVAVRWALPQRRLRRDRGVGLAWRNYGVCSARPSLLPRHLRQSSRIFPYHLSTAHPSRQTLSRSLKPCTAARAPPTPSNRLPSRWHPSVPHLPTPTDNRPGVEAFRRLLHPFGPVHYRNTGAQNAAGGMQSCNARSSPRACSTDCRTLGRQWG
jgi:hypothetical protein